MIRKRVSLTLTALPVAAIMLNGCSTDTPSAQQASSSTTSQVGGSADSSQSDDSNSVAPDATTASGENSTAAEEPAVELAVDGPVYENLSEALDDSLAVVEGTVTRRIGSFSQVEPGAEPDDPTASTDWAIYELRITDRMGTKAPTTVAVVDFDRETQSVESEQVAVMEGMTGHWALNTADSPSEPLMSEVGYTYYPVYFTPSKPMTKLPDGSPLPQNVGASEADLPQSDIIKLNSGVTLRAAKG